MSEKIKNMLTYTIFKKPEAALDKIENEFLQLHRKEFTEYKKEYASLMRMNMNVKRLKGGYYLDIYLDYCKRVHIHSVIAGIKKGKELAVKYNKPIVAFGWYKQHIDFHHKQRLSQVHSDLLRLEMKVDLPWYFNIFKAICSGELQGKEFDLWTGYREMEVEPSLDVQISILKGQQSNLYYKMMKLQSMKSRTQVEEEALSKLKAHYYDLVDQIAELQEAIDAE